MTTQLTRREFIRAAGITGAATLALPALAREELAKKSKIGATFILWGYGADDLEPSLSDMANLGYHSFETFGHVIQEWEDKRGGFKQVVEKHGVPIVSAFCATDVLDPSKRESERKKLERWAQLLKQNGGKVIEYCPTGGRPVGYNYLDHKKDLIDSMNEYAKVVTDQGLVCALHPHTGTPIETRDEVYFIMENLDTKYMKFGPDIGQLAKGGSDPVKIVQDFLPLVEHVHLKDYAGGNENGYMGYAPLGEGKVDLKKILTILEERRNKMAGMIMFELDSDKKHKMPMTEFESAKVSRNYLKNLGYRFST